METRNIQSELSKTLGAMIRNKATELSQHTDTPITWGKRYVPQFFFNTGCKFHEDLSNCLHDMAINRGQKLVIMAPRGNAKSTICSTLAPLKAVCEGTEKYIVLVSDTSELACSLLKTLKDELENNEQLKAKYPLACTPGAIWNADRFETANGVCVQALGKGGSVRGMKFKQYRPTLVILDDPQNDEEIMSPVGRIKDLNWFNRALMPIGDKGTNFFVIGTNLHRECIVNVVSKRSDFTARKYASIVTWPLHMDLWDEWEGIYNGSGKDKGLAFYNANREAMHEGAEVLWEHKEGLYELMCMRAVDHAAFASEKQNEPRDPSRCEFDESWFTDDVYYDTIPANPKHSYIVVGYSDPAKGGENKKRDYAANIILTYDVDLGICYVTCDIKRRPVAQLCDDIIRLRKVHKPLVFGIESNGFQELVGDEIMAKDPLAPIAPVENYGVHKHTRISRLSIWFQRKFFRFKRGCRDTQLLMQQIFDHPHSDHDDGPDALEGALRMLTQVSDLDTPMSDDTDIDDDGLGDNVIDALNIRI